MLIRGLSIFDGKVVDIVVSKDDVWDSSISQGKIISVCLKPGEVILSSYVVITIDTFLDDKIYIRLEIFSSEYMGEAITFGLSKSPCTAK